MKLTKLDAIVCCFLGGCVTTCYVVYVTITHGDGYVLGTAMTAIGAIVGWFLKGQQRKS